MSSVNAVNSVVGLPRIVEELDMIKPCKRENTAIIREYVAAYLSLKTSARSLENYIEVTHHSKFMGIDPVADPINYEAALLEYYRYHAYYLKLARMGEETLFPDLVDGGINEWGTALEQRKYGNRPHYYKKTSLEYFILLKLRAEVERLVRLQAREPNTQTERYKYLSDRLAKARKKLEIVERIHSEIIVDPLKATYKSLSSRTDFSLFSQPISFSLAKDGTAFLKSHQFQTCLHARAIYYHAEILRNRFYEKVKQGMGSEIAKNFHTSCVEFITLMICLKIEEDKSVYMSDSKGYFPELMKKHPYLTTPYQLFRMEKLFLNILNYEISLSPQELHLYLSAQKSCLEEDIAVYHSAKMQCKKQFYDHLDNLKLALTQSSFSVKELIKVINFHSTLRCEYFDLIGKYQNHPLEKLKSKLVSTNTKFQQIKRLMFKYAELELMIKEEHASTIRALKSATPAKEQAHYLAERMVQIHCESLRHYVQFCELRTQWHEISLKRSMLIALFQNTLHGGSNDSQRRTQ